MAEEATLFLLSHCLSFFFHYVWGVMFVISVPVFVLFSFSNHLAELLIVTVRIFFLLCACVFVCSLMAWEGPCRHVHVNMAFPYHTRLIVFYENT